MKVSIVLFITGVIAAISYLMGTESGRERRDGLVARVRKTSNSAADSATDVIDSATDVVADKAEQLAS
jgi:hypothetical protein